MKIMGLGLDSLVSLVEEGILLLQKNCGAAKNYGFLTVYDAMCGHGVLLGAKINICPQEKSEKYFILSIEKAKRLSESRNLLSWQSRDPANNKWGGAVVVRVNTVLSFSGMDELEDEALVIYVAHKAGWIDRAQALELAAISSNPHVAKIL